MAGDETKAIIRCDNCNSSEEVKIKDIVIENKAVTKFKQIAYFYCFNCSSKCQLAWVEFVER